MSITDHLVRLTGGWASKDIPGDPCHRVTIDGDIFTVYRQSGVYRFEMTDTQINGGIRAPVLRDDFTAADLCAQD